MKVVRGTALAVVAVAAVVAVGCGSSGSSSSTSSSTTSQAAVTTTTVATTTTAAAAAPTTTAAPAGGSAMAGVPAPAGATQQHQDAIAGGGVHTYYTTAQGPGEVVSQYGAALQGAGWAVQSSGGGGSAYGGGAGLTATEGPRYLVLSAGGQPGQTNIDLCVWPTRPADDGCGSDSGHGGQDDQDEDN